MSSARSVRPTDLVALAAFDRRLRHNEAHTWERLGSSGDPPRVIGSAAQEWLPLAGRRRTWVVVHGPRIRGLISARPRGRPTAWEVDRLMTADDERVVLGLFDQLTAGAVAAGAHKVFLRLDADSEILVAARKAGFVPYAVEHLLRLDVPRQQEEPLPAGLWLRPRERTDEYGLFQLYNRVAPLEVRAVEANTLAEWQAAVERRGRGRGAADIVVEREGRVVGWLRTDRAGGAGRFDVVLAPDEWPAADALIAWGLRDLGAARPVYAAVPEYAGPLIERLQSAGFALAGEYALLAKRLMQLIRATKPVRATVKPVATV